MQPLPYLGARQGRRDNFKLYINRRVFRVLFIAKSHLMRTERRATTRAMSCRLVTQIDKPPVPHLFYRPPDGLDVVILHGDVGVLKVTPVGDALGQRVPVLEITENALPAASIEFGDTIFLNLCLAGKAKLPLHFQLHGKAMRIPAADARRVVAFHRPVARNDILENAGKNVVDAGAAIGRWRTLVEGKAGAALPVLHTPLKDFIFLPPLEDLFFNLRQLKLAAHRTEHGFYSP
ncbi:hypothetical protein ES703_25312 [subsurface metagenome]